MTTFTIRINESSGATQSIQVSGPSDAKQMRKIHVPKGAKIQLIDDQTGLAPDNVRIERVGNDLWIGFPGADMTSPDLVLEEFYTADSTASLVGEAENGFIYEYIPESGASGDYLAQVTPSVITGQVLGGPSVSPFFAALPAGGAAAGIGALGIAGLAGLVGLGAAAALASSGGGRGQASVTPAAPDARLDDASDSGTKGDNRTTDSTPTISGRGTEVGNRITVVLPTGETLTTTVDANGNWSVTPTRALTLGANPVTVTETNASGISSPVTTLNLVIESDAPPLTGPAAPLVPDLTAASDSGVSNTDNRTNDNTPTFAVTAPAAGQTTSLYVDGIKVPATFNPATGTLTPNTPLTDGAHTITSTLTNAAGLESPQSSALTVVIDTVAPVTPAAPDLTAATDSGLSNTDNITNDATPAFAIAAPAAGETPSLYVDGVKVPATFNAATNTLVPVTPLTNGTHTITTTLTDVAGNESAPSPGLAVVIDTVPPANAPDLTVLSDTGSSNTDNITNDNTPSFAVGAPAAGETANLYVDGVLVPSTYDVATGTLTPVTPIAEGSHLISSTLSDVAGNESTLSPPLTLVIDTVAPGAFTASALPEGPVINAAEALSGGGVPITVALPAGAAAGDLITVTIDGTAVPYTVTANDVSANNATVLLPSSAIAAAGEGAATVTVAYTDLAGNSSASPQSIALTIDTVAPAVVVTPVGAGIKTPAQASDPAGVLTVNGEPGSTSTVTFVGTAGTVVKIVANDGSAKPVTLTAQDLATLGNGGVEATTVTTDAAGNITNTPDNNDGDFILQAPTAISVQVGEGPVINAVEATSGGGVPVSVFLPANAVAGDVITVTLDGTAVPAQVVTAADVAAGVATVLVPTSAVTAAGQGPASLVVSYANAGGGTATNSPVSTDLTIDTIAPAAPAAPDLTNASDTGASPTDNITNDTTPTFAIAAPGANEVPNLYVDGALVPSTFDPATNTLTPNAPLSSGPHNITTTLTDAAGNVSPPSPQLVVVIDTTAPGALTPNVDEGPSINALEASDGVVVRVTLPAGAAAGDVITVSIDNGVPVTYTVAAADVGTPSVNVTLPVAAVNAAGQGDALVTVLYADAAGNPAANSPQTVALTIDTLAPAAPVAPDLTAATDSGIPTDNVTNVSRPSFAVPPPAEGGIPSLYVDGVRVPAGYDPATNTLTPNVALGNGPHVITSTVTDAAGNESPQSPALAITIDGVPPTATILVGDNALRAGETSPVTITFSEAPGASFTLGDLAAENGVLSNLVMVNATTYTAVLTPTAGITDTSNVVTLTAGSYNDVAGNAGTVATSNNYAIDTVPPAAPTGVLPADAINDTGISASDNITNNSAPTLSGTTEAGTTVVVTVNGVSYTATVNGTGWTVSLTGAALPDNSYTPVITATDAAGNITIANGETFTVDTIAPTTPVVAPDMTAATDTGPSNTDNNTADNTPDFVIPAPGVGNSPSLYVDGIKVAAVYDATNGTLTPSSPIGNGNHVISYTLTDVAGNESGLSPSLPVVINATVPATPAGAPDLTAATDSGVSNSDNITNDSTPDFAIAAPGAGNTPSLYVDGVKVAAVYDGINGTLTPVTPLTQGVNHSIAYTLTNGAGGESALSPALNLVLVDTTAPTATIVVDDNALRAGETSPVTITFSEAPTGFVLGDLVAENGVLSNLVMVNATTYTAVLTPTAGITDTSNVITLAAGSYGDLAGNAGAIATSNNYAIDTLPPVAPTGVLPVDAINDTGVSASDNITRNNAPTLSGTTEADTTVVVRINGVDYTATVNGTGWTVSLTGAALPDGAYTPVITATDAAGNITTANGETFTVDTVAPTTPVVAPDMTAATDTGASNTDNNTADSTPDFAIPAPGAGNTLSLYVDGVKVTAVYDATAGTLTPTSPIGNGNHVISYTLTDVAGNESGLSPSLPVVINATAPAAPLVAPDMTAATDSGIPTDNITNDSTPDFAISAPGAGNTPSLYVDGVKVAAVYDGINGTLTPVTPLTEGVSHSIAYTFTNSAGGESPLSPALNLVLVDTTAPTATIVVDDVALRAGETSPVTITFSEAPGASFTLGDLAAENGVLSNLVMVNATTYTAVLTPTAGITDTSNVVTLTAGSYNDVAGNAGTVATSNNYAIDTVPPAAPTGVLPADAINDTGISASDNITNNSAPTLSGTTEAGTTVVVTVNGVSYTATVNGTGWTVSLTGAALPDNSYTPVITATDAAGNITIANGETFTVDTIAPTTPVVAPDMTAATDTGPSNTDNNTADNTPDFVIPAPGVGNSPSLYVDGIKVAAVYDATNGTLTPSSPIGNGNHVISYTLTDVAGNESGLSPSLPVVINATVPATPAGAPDLTAATDSGVSNSDNITNDSTPDFAIAAPGAGNTPSLYVDGVKVAAVYDGINGTLTPVTPLTQGVNHSIAYTLTNGAGGESALSPALNLVLVDTTAPTATIVVDDNALRAGETSPVTITFSEAPTGFVLGDLVAENGVLSNLVMVNATTYTAVLTPTAGITDTSNVITLAAGSYGDLAGNAGAIATSNNYAIDTLPPVAPTGVLPADAINDTGVSASDNITRNNAPTLSGTTEADTTVVVSINGVNYTATVNGTGWTVSLTGAALPDGAYTPVITATDAAGNITTANGETFTVDTVAPVFTSAAAVSFAENTPATTTVIDVNANDATAVYSIAGGNDAGQFTINPTTGVIQFIASPNFEAPTDVGADNVYNIIVTATDAAGNITTQPIAITVTNVNDAPVISSNGGGDNATITVAENTTAVTTVTSTDADAGSTRTYSITGGADAGLFTINSATGALAFISGRDFEAPTDVGADNVYNVVVTATDNGALTDSQAIAVTVTNANDAPVAVNDTLSATEDTLVTYSAAQLLGNDTDVDGNTLTIASVTSGAGGTAVLNADGTVSFTPNANFNGPASFTYTVSDGTLTSNTATVTVNVAPVNDAPVAVNDTLSATEDTLVTYSAAQLLGNDTDVDGNTLTIASVTSGAGGTAVLNADGTVSFTPNANFNGPASFTYTVSDGTLTSNTATVTVNVAPVNDAPVAVNDTLSATEDTLVTYSAAQLLGNDTDVDGNTLTIASVTSGAGGTAVLNADGTVSFTPNANFNGPASFTYTVSDGTLTSNTATVTVNVAPVNDAPVAVNDTLSATEDTLVTYSAAQLLGNDTDVDGNTLTIASVTSGAGGTAVLNADGTVSFTPNANFNGPASFTYTVSDGTLTSNTATVTVNVAPVNDAPVAVNDTLSATEDTLVTYSAAQLLGNDTDVDGNTLTIASVTSGAGGTAVLNADGTVSFTPNANFNGPASFTYTVSDGTLTSNTATVTVNVAPVNDAPVAVNDTLSATEDTLVTYSAAQLLGNDTDVDGNTLTIASVTSGAGGTAVLNADGTVSFTPNANFNGPASFTYTVSDGTLTSNTATVTVNVAPVNDAPVAVNDTLSATEDTLVTYSAAQLLGNDTDVDGNTLTIASVTSGAGGTAVLNADGTVSFTPNANFNGPASFTYTVSDGTLTSNTATVTVNVAPVNDAPVAVNDTLSATEDTLVTYSAAQLLGNDTDVDGNTLTIASVTSGAGGTAVLNADGTVSFTPNANFNGPASFTYTVSDGTLTSNTATVTVNVAPVNDAPVAVNDTLSATEDTLVTYSAAQLLGNDTDVDGNTLTIASVTSGAGGTAVLNADGTVSFTPNANFNGPASFTYTVSDGTLTSNTATVTVNVAPVNDAPVAVNDTLSATEDTLVTYSAAQLLGNDTDVDGNTLTIASVTSGAGGTAVLNADGTVSFTPNANFNGPASFTYTVSDGTLTSNTATVTVNVAPVNDAPVAVNDTLSATEDTLVTYSAAQLLGNDTDVDGNTLTIASVTSGAGGTAVLNADGTVSFTPNANFNGPASFTYTVSDGTLTSNTATVTVNVAPVNDAPVAVNDTLSATEDTLVTYSAAQLLGNDTDVDGNTLTIASVTSGAGGTAVLNADGTVSFTPNANFNGPASFTYTVSDGTLTSNTATVTVNVAPVNDAPVAVNDTLSATEDTLVTYSAAQLLGNDTDVDGNTLTIASVTSGAGGTAVLNADGTVSFTPNANFNGPASFTYTVSDGTLTSNTATVTVNVAPVNDAPVAVNDTLSATEDTLVTYSAAQLLGNDTDVDGNTLTIASVTSGAGGTAVLNADGTVSFTPNANFNGPASFTYTVSDGTLTSNTATVTVNVAPVNDAPVAVNDTLSATEDTLVTYSAAQLLGNDTDVDGNTLTIASVTSGAGGTAVLNADGTVSFTPNANFNGPASFTYTVSDGTLTSNTATVTVNVAPVNDAPVAVNDTLSATEDTLVTYSAAQLLGNDTDVDGNTLTIASVTSGAGGTAVLNADGTVSFTPNANFNGPASFTYTVSDGTLTSNTATVTVNVAPVNDAPVAVNDTLSATEDTLVTYSAAQLLGNDTDVDGNTLTIASVTSGAGGTAVLNADGTVSFTPNANFNGPASFTYTVSDGTLTSNTATVTVNVAPVNDAPVAVNDTLSATEDTLVTYSAAQLLGNDTDVDGNTLTIASVTSGAGGTAVLNADGTVSFTPNANFNGPASFTYTVSDGTLTSNTATVTVNVAPVNDAPVAVNDTLSATEDTLVTYSAAQLLGNDTDVDGNTLTIASVTSGAGGTAVLNADGTVSFTPNANFNGPASFTYTVSDGTLTSNTATVTVNVAPVNDAPVAVNDTLSATEDTLVTYSAAQLLGNDTDVDGNTLTIASVTSGAGGTAVLNADGTVSFTPNANFNGPASFTYTVSDGTLTSNTATVTVNVAPVNDAPVAVNDTLSATEDTLVTYSAAQLLGNDTDVDGNTLTIASVTSGAGGTAVLNADGTVSFTPNANFNGPASFTYTVSDGTLTSNTATVTVNVAPVNDAPVAVNDTLSATEDTLVTYSAAQLLGNDTDVDGNTLTIASVTSGAGGTAVLNADGTVSFTPNANFNGPASFTYTVSDGTLTSNTATVTVNVAPVNDAPVAVNDTLSATEDTLVTYSAAQLLGNDTDVDGNTLTIASVTSGAGGTAVLNADGTVSFTPNANFNGPASFTYTVSDGTLTSNTATVTVNVAPVNDAPVAVNDTLSATEDTLVTYSAAQLLGNDTDVDGNTLTIASVTSGAGGTAVLNADGTVSFTPNANFNGPASFTYTVSDGTLTSNTATVTVNVAPVNDAPVAVNDTLSATEDTLVTYSAAQLLGNDTDVDGNTLTIASVTSGAGGTAVLNADGTVSFTPNANFNGPASFTYTVSDGTLTSNTATVTVNVAPVNDAPVAVNDTLSATEDTLVTYSAAQLLGNDTDVDGNTLTIASVTSGAGGTAVLNADGTVSFTPNANFNGPASFTYTVSDGTLTSNTATVTVNVAPVNDAPVAVNDTLSATEDTLVTYSAAQLLGNDTDVDGNTLTIASVTSGAGGTAVLNADGTVSFTPNANFNGPASFTYTVSDGTLTSNTATVTVNVAPVNDAPVAVNDTLSATEDTLVTYSAAQLLGNDTDVDGNTLTIASVTSGAGGTAVLNADGTVSFTPNANFNGPASFTYTVSDGTLTSNTATVTVNVAPVNDAPVAVNDTLSATEDTLVTYSAAQLLGNDTDVDGNTLTIASVTSGAGGTAVLNADGTVSFTPNANFNGPASFTYTVSDGTLTSNTATVTVNVAPVNDAPVAVNDTLSATEDTLVTYSAAQLLGNDTDVDGNTLTIASVTSGAGGTAVLNADGTVSFTPNANFNGPASFTYTVSDGTLTSNTATVTVNVAPVNDAPVAVNDTLSATEDTLVTYSAAQLLGNDTDVDGNTLTIASVTSGAGGTAVLNADGTVSFTPNANFNGPASFSYTVSDGTLTSNTATVTVNVAPVNDAPVAVNDTGTATEDTTLTVTAANGVLTNDTDVDAGDTRTVTQFTFNGTTVAAGQTINAAGIGSLSIAANGSYVFTPALNYNGTAPAATYTLADAAGATATATLTISVTPVNDAPVGVNDTGTATEDTTLTVTAANGVLTNDTDVDAGDTRTVTQFTFNGTTVAAGQTINAAGIGSLSIAANGSYVFTPALNYNGTAPAATYTLADAAGATATATLTISVTPVNDAPVGVNDTGTATEDTTLTVTAANGVLTNDTDVDAGDTRTVTQFTFNGTTVAAGQTINAAGIGSLSIAANGSYVFTPALNYNGTAPAATYTLADAAGATATATLTISVTPVNDAPVGVNDTGTATEDTTLTVTAANGVLTNDTDVDAGDTRTVTQFTFNGTTVAAGQTINAAGIGSLSIAANGSYVFTPALNYNGTAPAATYTLADAAGATATATLTISVTPVNDAPVGVNDTGTATEDTTLTVTAANGVLTNDTDVDAGDTRTVTQFTFNGTTVAAGQTINAAGIGSLSIAANGSYVFTPALNYNGTAPAATYTLADAAGATATATLTISVTPVNDAPVGVNDTGTATEDTTLTVTAANGVLTNDTDVDAGDTRTVTQFTFNGTTVAAGQTINAAGIGSLSIAANGSYVFTPALNYNGTAPAATYTLADAAGATATATLTISVTPVADAPAGANATLNLNEDATRTLAIADFGFTDADGDAFASVTVSTLPTAGTLTVGGVAVTQGQVITAAQLTGNQVVFTPVANANGAAYSTFNFAVTDATGLSDATPNTITFNVAPINDSPTATNLTQNLVLNEDAAAVNLFTAAPVVTDIDSANVTATLTIATAAGVLTGTNVGAGVVNGANTVYTITGTQAVVNAALAGVRYDSADNFNGAVNVAVAVTDGQNGPQGAANPTGTVSITANPVNDPIALDLDGDNNHNVVTVGAIAGLFNTGLNVAGNALLTGNGAVAGNQDSHWLVDLPTAGTAYVTPRRTTPAAGWVADDTNNGAAAGTDTLAGDLSAWIGTSASGGNTGSGITAVANGDYTYRTSFSLAAGVDIRSVTLTFDIAVNDFLTDILVNGVSTGIRIPANSTGLTRVQLSGADYAFIASAVANNNTLDFVVHNGPLGSAAGTSTEGFRIDNFSGTAATISGNANPATGYAGVYTENAAPIRVVDTDVTITQAVAGNIASATVTLTNLQTGDLIGNNALPAGIVGSYDAAAGVYTLTGSATAAQYQTALQALVFSNTSDTPSTTTRVISVSVTDVTGNFSNVPTSSITVIAVNDAPVAVADTITISEPGPGLIYGFNNGTTSLVAWDPISGASTTIGNAGINSLSLALASDGLLYTVNSATNVLYTINPATGAATIVAGATAITPAANAINALVGDDLGNLYGVRTDNGQIFNINRTTGVGTAVGTFGAGTAGDVVYVNGFLYSTSDNNTLIRYDLSTGAVVTYTNNLPGAITGLVVDSDGTFYGVQNTGTSYRFNLTDNEVNNTHSVAFTQLSTGGLALNDLASSPLNGQFSKITGDVTPVAGPGRDSDPDSATFSVTGVQAGTTAALLNSGADTVVTGTYGTVRIAADGSYTYTLNNADPDSIALGLGQSGNDVFSYTITDDLGRSATTTLTVTVNGTDHSPRVAAILGTEGSDGSAAAPLNGTNNAGNNIVIGGQGDDFLAGGAGADRFVWRLGEAATANHAAQSGAVDTITDFNRAQNDTIDLSDLLLSAAGRSTNPLTSTNLNSFLQLTADPNNAANSVLRVDLDGTGGFAAPELTINLTGNTLATLVSIQDLYNSGRLVVL